LSVSRLRDLDLARLGDGELRCVHFEDALAELRLDVLRVGLGRELEAALELAVEALV
jgi:hypothetical protein